MVQEFKFLAGLTAQPHASQVPAPAADWTERDLLEKLLAPGLKEEEVASIFPHSVSWDSHAQKSFLPWMLKLFHTEKKVCLSDSFYAAHASMRGLSRDLAFGSSAHISTLLRINPRTIQQFAWSLMCEI